MLVKKSYQEDAVATFKLVNGDEVVAKVISETPTYFLISKPCTVMPSQQGVGLLQSLFTSVLENNIELSKSHIMMHSKTHEDVENYYIQTTTGIEPVTAGSIIT